MTFKGLMPVLALALLMPLPQSVAHEGHDDVFEEAGGQIDGTTRALPIYDIGQKVLKFALVKQGSVRQVVAHLTGSIQPVESLTHEIRPLGEVSRLLVKKNDLVTGGILVAPGGEPPTPLAMIRSQEIVTLLADFLKEKQEIETKIMATSIKLNGDIDAKSIEASHAAVDLGRQSRLLQSQSTAVQVYDDQKKVTDLANRTLSKLKQELAHDLASLQNTLAQETRNARAKAKLMGLSAEDFNRALEKKEAVGEVPFFSTVSGVVISIEGEPLDSRKMSFTIADLSQLWVVLNAPEDLKDQVKVGQKLKATSATKQAIEGVISSVGLIDPNSYTFPVRALIANPDRTLAPGMSLIAGQIALAETEHDLTIPASALVEEDGQMNVYVKVGDVMFKRVPVTVRMRGIDEHSVETVAIDGLQENETVVTEGGKRLQMEAGLLRRGVKHAIENPHDSFIHAPLLISPVYWAIALLGAAVVIWLFWGHRK